MHLARGVVLIQIRKPTHVKMQRNQLAQWTSYNIREWYFASKLGLYLMSRELCRRYKSTELCSICVDPAIKNKLTYAAKAS
ncbi:short-chain dehydrogenase TIC 32 [Tropilaelaps mercedesae]|uniref:Short-chain dehydrogenase TIC 32 n=1 Tax=Tropilaelaps mercedesae TaxID=418985 RepID=A0A1V9XIE4_9ACAR|nr:short-chain dehydrogenase TIC 32 [Tropilaelaps mercedesae]